MTTALQITSLLVVPVLLLKLTIIPFNQRLFLLAAVVVVTMLCTYLENISWKALGMRWDNIWPAGRAHAGLTVMGVVGLVMLAQWLHEPATNHWWADPHFQGIFLLVSAAQEFVYHSYFQTKLQQSLRPWLAILIIASLYTGMHLLWPNQVVIWLTLIAGLSWGILWKKYPNFYVSTLSHAILNFTAVYLGFFS